MSAPRGSLAVVIGKFKWELAPSNIMVSADAIFIDPYGDIDRAISSRNWIAGFSSACTYLEHFGAIKIRNKFSARKVKRMRVSNIICHLLKFNVIDIEAHRDLDAVIKFRNDLVHPARKGIGYQHTLDQSEAKRLLLIAKRRILQIQETKI